MPIYNAQFGSGLMGLQPGFEGLAQGIAGRMHPDARKKRSEMSEITQWITPLGEIDKNAPRAIRKQLEQLMAEGRIYANPENVGEFYIGDSPGEGLNQFTGQSFYDLWGHANRGESPTRGVPPTGQSTDVVQQGFNFFPQAYQPTFPQMQQLPEVPSPMGPMVQQQGIHAAQAPDPTNRAAMPPNIASMLEASLQARYHTDPMEPYAPPNPIQEALLQAMMNPLVHQASSLNPQPQFVPRMESGGPVKKQKTQIDAFLELLGIDKSEIPIVAHEGEYVLNKNAVDMIGKENLEQVNQLGQAIPRMERGGSVGSNPTSRGSMQEAGPQGIPPELQAAMEKNAMEKQMLEQALMQRIAVPPGGIQAPQPGVGETGLPQMHRSREQEDADAAMMNRIDTMQYHGYDMPANQGEPRATSHSGHRVNNQENTRDAYRGSNRFVSTPFQEPGPVQSDWNRLPEHYYYPDDKLKAVPNPEEPQPREEVKKGEVPQKAEPRGDSSPPTPQKEGTIPKRDAPKVYYRNPGAGMNVDWEAVSDMEPSQAMAYLQQVANTQGRTTNINYGDGSSDPRGELFRDMMSHYSNLVGIEDAVNERYWKDLAAPHNIDKLKYETQKLAAQSPYFSAMAEADINYADARTRLLGAQASLAQKEFEALVNGTGVDPADMLKNYKTVQEIKNAYTRNLDNAVNTAFHFATETKNGTAWKDFYQKSLFRDFVTGARDIDEDYKVLVESIGKGKGFRGHTKNTLSTDEVDRLREAAREHRAVFSNLESLRPGRPQSGNSELATLLAALEIME